MARAPGETVWRDWTYRRGMSLKLHDHAGVGHLELVDDMGRLASWRFTLGQNLLAQRLSEAFVRLQDAFVNGQPPVKVEDHSCPTCKAPLEPDQEECPVCTKVVYTPPSTWTLFRLWRFAKPYRWPLGFGFALMLLSTGAHMIPPYLSKPLMDDVLIPYQNGKPVDVKLVAMYMAGLTASAVLAWILGWG
ncbi:ABC transporter, partial [Pseudoduganella sp. RAF53_2]